MRYNVFLTVRGHSAAYHVFELFPGLELRDTTPSFRQNRPGYEPTARTLYELSGDLTSSHDLTELADAIELIGTSFVELRVGSCTSN